MMPPEAPLPEPALVLREVTRQAIRRETCEAMQRGERLFQGKWLDPKAYEAATALRRKRRMWQNVEALAYWAVVLLMALALMALAVVVV